MEIISCEQGSQEWLDLRLGIITMSEIKLLLGKPRSKKEFFSQMAISYMYELIAERITGELQSHAYSKHIVRGHEEEPIARQLYEEITSNLVTECGFIKNHCVGYSPDGLVGINGLIEIKSKIPKEQCRVIIDDNVPIEHIHQVQGGLWVSEREWCDFISYSRGMPIFIKRAYRDEKMISFMTEKVALFYEELEKRMNIIIGG